MDDDARDQQMVKVNGNNNFYINIKTSNSLIVIGCQTLLY